MKSASNLEAFWKIIMLVNKLMKSAINLEAFWKIVSLVGNQFNYVTQLKLYTLDKLSCTLFCCL